jgi:hypothetical protein
MKKTPCTHSNSNSKELIPNSPEKIYYFCVECGCIILKLNNNNDSYLYTTKPLLYQERVDINPLDIFNSFKDLEYPIINSQWSYFKNRQRNINLLQKYLTYYKYSESTFYLALHYLDTIYSTLNGGVVQKKKNELFVINCLLIAGKFYEKDSFQPRITRFCSIGIQYDIDEIDICRNELEVLKILNYKLNVITAYDILSYLLFNGIIFEPEIENRMKEFSHIIYCYAKKIFNDIILSNIAIQFSPIQIVFSVIHLTRKNFNLKQNYFNVIKKFYNYHLNDYKTCLNICKKFLNNELNSLELINYKSKVSLSMKNNLPKLDNNIENENNNKIYENKENDNNNEINNNNDEENNIISIEKEEGDLEIKKKIGEEEININSKKKFNKLGIKRYDSLNTKNKEEKVVVTPNINNINNENKNINISKNKNCDIKKKASKFNNIHKKISLFKRKRSNSQFFTSKFEDMFEIITQATNDNIFDNINLYGGDNEENKIDENNNIEIISLNSFTSNKNNRNSFHKKIHKDSIDFNNKNSYVTNEYYGNMKRSNSNENLIDKKLKNNYFDDLDFEENIFIETKKVKKKIQFGPIQSKKTFNENNKKKYKKTFSLFHKK